MRFNYRVGQPEKTLAPVGGLVYHAAYAHLSCCEV